MRWQKTLRSLSAKLTHDGTHFSDRYFELISLGGRGEGGAFLVYYEGELRQHVRGYICLDGATLAEVPHESEAHVMRLTSPARRLSLLTPGVAAGPLGSPTAPPSVEEKMGWLEKVDNWGRGAVRNLMASGPLDAPVNTWTLAAPYVSPRTLILALLLRP